MASLKLNGLSKVYPSGETALYNVDLEAEEGEFLVILGAESSGKSTLLRVVAGLEECTDGTVFINKKDVTEAEPKDRDIAMVFKSETLYPSQSIYDNIAFGLKLRKASQALIEQRVKSAASILGLTDVLYRKPKALTAAARQRVAVARAMVREPKLYLFDEPLSGLDEKLRADLLNVIINVQARMNGTFVYATKELGEALAIGTRIVVMKNGMVQQIDTPANLYDYPANAYVAFYIGSPTINFLQNTKIVKDEGGYFAECKGNKFVLSEKIVNRFKEISGYAESGKEVILGIRPEDIKISSDGLSGKVEKVESDNDKTFAECSVNGGLSIIVTGQSDISKGSEVKLSVDPERLYIFDGDTRLTLLCRDEGYTKTDFADADFKPMSFADEQAVTEKLKPNKAKKK